MNQLLRSTVAPLLYLVSAVVFFLGLKALTRVRSARRGRPLIAMGLFLAAAGAIAELGTGRLAVFGACVGLGGVVGAILASRLPAAPSVGRVAWLPGLAGLGSGLVAIELAFAYDLWSLQGAVAAVAAFLGVTSGYVALGLLRKPKDTPSNAVEAALVAACAGWSVALVGLLVSNAILLIVGGVAGTAGLALGRTVAAAAGRSLFGLLFGAVKAGDSGGYDNIRSCGTEEAAMVMESAHNVLIVPGLGMAIAQAQHAVKEVGEQLEKRGAKVRYVVAPSAGCIPGHMNILLDEAGVPHDRLVFVEDAGPFAKEADAVLVIGAADIVNVAAAADPKNPLFGMPALDLSGAGSVFVVKRSLRAGLAGVKNPLFEQSHTTMIFGDAKKVMQGLIAELKSSRH
jgi:NAD(P) transhydrogenase subunit beta